MLRGGYTGKILRIDLGTRQVWVERVGEADILRFLGGRGLAARYYYNEIAPSVQPLDAANKLFFFTGPLTGVALPSTTKFHLSTKSPETGLYLCSNSSGDFGVQLKGAGFDGLIIQGQAPDWSYLLIRDGEVTFGDARAMAGLTSSQTRQALIEAIGDARASTIAVGPAGERQVRMSCLNVAGRAFGRGGSGAVFGAKKLKGIALRGSGGISVANEARVARIRQEAVAVLRETRANHTKYGTAQYVEVINELGCMPTRNFQTSYFEAGHKVDAHAMLEGYVVKNYACYRCPVACGKVVEVRKGPFAGSRARPEYETIGMFGPCCGIDDFAAIVAANELCDELGMDTISAANAVALIMELFERGLITPSDTDGIAIRFGDGQAMLQILRLIAERRGIGDLLAEGMAGVAARHPEWRRYILAVKGMPFPAYDPRGFHGMGLAYGTSSRGACHNYGGWTIRDELQSGKYDRYALEGKAELVKRLQDTRAYVDSLGICTVVRSSMGFTDHPEGDTLLAVTGYDFTPELMDIGARIYTLERLILNREGVRRKDDLLPERMTREVVPSGPSAGRVLTEQMYTVMLDEYYGLRGWDADGVPTADTVRKLCLHDSCLL
jgi:aldehyde:ferredoxin oxidoreductase